MQPMQPMQPVQDDNLFRENPSEFKPQQQLKMARDGQLMLIPKGGVPNTRIISSLISREKQRQSSHFVENEP